MTTLTAIRSRGTIDQYLFDRIKYQHDKRFDSHSLETSFVLNGYTTVDQALSTAKEMTQAVWTNIQDMRDMALYYPSLPESSSKYDVFNDAELKFYLDRFVFENAVDALRGTGRYEGTLPFKLEVQPKGPEIRFIIAVCWSKIGRHIRVSIYGSAPAVNHNAHAYRRMTVSTISHMLNF